jgi:hypothetical protein
VLFEALAPFAILFQSGWQRVAEGVVVAAVLATLHPRPTRRSAAAALAAIGVYFLVAAVYASITFGHRQTFALF